MPPPSYLPGADPMAGMFPDMGDLMRQQRQQQLFSSLGQFGAGLMQAGMGGPYGSRQQGMGQAMQAFQGAGQGFDPMDMLKAKYMMGQLDLQKKKLEAGEAREKVKGADGYWYYQDTGERVLPDIAKTEDPLPIERKADLYQAENPGASRMEALNWAKTSRVKDLSDKPLTLEEAQTLNVPMGTTHSQVRGRTLPPPGVSTPPGGLAPPQPDLMSGTPSAPMAGAVPPPPPPPPTPAPPALGPTTPMEETARSATGLASNAQAAVDAFIGGVFGADPTSPENMAARTELTDFVTDARAMIAQGIDEGRLAVQEQQWAQKNLPLPEEILKSPVKAAGQIAKARERWEQGIARNNVSLQGTISDKERQRLLDQNQTYSRMLARMGPKPGQGSTMSNPITVNSNKEAQALPPGTHYNLVDDPEVWIR